MMRRTVATVAALGLPLALLAGCGDDTPDNPFDDLSTAEIKELIVEGMSSVESLRMSAKLQLEEGSFSIVIVLDRDANCDGSLSIGGGRADIRGDGTWSYLKGDETFWLESSGGGPEAEMVIATIGDKWVRSPADETEDFCDLDSFLDDIATDDDSDEDFRVGDIEEVEGVETVKLIGTEPDEETGDTTTMWVTVEAPHRVVKAVIEGGSESGEMTFTKYNEPVNAQIPGEDEWIDLDELG